MLVGPQGTGPLQRSPQGQGQAPAAWPCGGGRATAPAAAPTGGAAEAPAPPPQQQQQHQPAPWCEELDPFPTLPSLPWAGAAAEALLSGDATFPVPPGGAAYAPGLQQDQQERPWWEDLDALPSLPSLPSLLGAASGAMLGSLQPELNQGVDALAGRPAPAAADGPAQSGPGPAAAAAPPMVPQQQPVPQPTPPQAQPQAHGGLALQGGPLLLGPPMGPPHGGELLPALAALGASQGRRDFRLPPLVPGLPPGGIPAVGAAGQSLPPVAGGLPGAEAQQALNLAAQRGAMPLSPFVSATGAAPAPAASVAHGGGGLASPGAQAAAAQLSQREKLRLASRQFRARQVRAAAGEAGVAPPQLSGTLQREAWFLQAGARAGPRPGPP